MEGPLKFSPLLLLPALLLLSPLRRLRLLLQGWLGELCVGGGGAAAAIVCGDVEGCLTCGLPWLSNGFGRLFVALAEPLEPALALCRLELPRPLGVLPLGVLPR